MDRLRFGCYQVNYILHWYTYLFNNMKTFVNTNVKRINVIRKRRFHLIPDEQNPEQNTNSKSFTWKVILVRSIAQAKCETIRHISSGEIGMGSLVSMQKKEKKSKNGPSRLLNLKKWWLTCNFCTTLNVGSVFREMRSKFNFWIHGAVLAQKYNVRIHIYLYGPGTTSLDLLRIYVFSKQLAF